MGVRVRATRPGFYGSFREVNAEFEVADGVTGSWFEPVDAPESIVPKPKRSVRDVKVDAEAHL